MKQDSKTHGQDILTVNDEGGFHLPFCGLGAEEYVHRNSTRCGIFRLEPSRICIGKLQETLTES